MFNKLQSKIVITLTVFIILVMTVIGTILINNIFSYYQEDFVAQMDGFFDEEHTAMLTESLRSDNYVESLKDKLTAYSSFLGIDPYRSFYILNSKGGFLDSNADINNTNITKTQNLISAINGNRVSKEYSSPAVMDYAVRLEDSGRCVIIYIADTRDEMMSISSIIFTIVLQALLVGIIIALILSFILSSVISAPIQKITATATRISEGDFSQRVEVHSKDEIGILSQAFNSMAGDLKSNLDEIIGEREKLSTIFSYLKDGVIAFDSSGKILHINQTAINLIGDDYDRDMTMSDFVTLLSIDYTCDELISDTASGESKVFLDIKFKQRVIDANFGSFRFEISDEPYVGYIAVIHDVTEHFELELARREFVANVSHELRTPLTGIKGAAETVIDNSSDMPPELVSHFLKMIVDESDRMTRIVHDLLMLSRLDDNRVSWKISSFSPTELLNNRAEIMQHEARSHNQKLAVEKVPDNIPMITADREKIDQVLTNIIQNAVKYTQDGGEITLSLNLKNIKNTKNLKDGQYIVFTVRDNGMGIPEADIPHLFERFYRVEKARTSDKGGTGLGLAISKDIITAHGGDITITSALDKGTAVFIYLPLKSSIKE
ncbi:MAG: cell wall metabolism sensor histidine kinase WalK [Ruminococcaceae bacterium]|nr:cell wall metabolism sensor histidine kinase WalK [Oscillospiraceae bacterium]